MGTTFDVFISYARGESTACAEALAAELTARGLRHYLDTRDARVDEPFPADIRDAMLGSRVIVVYPGQEYFKRWWCLKEWHLALAPVLRGKHVSDEARREAVAHIVVAWPDEGAAAAVDHLPPIMRVLNHRPARDAGALAAMVAERLAESPQSLSDRFAALKIIDEVVADYGSEERIPPPRQIPREIPFAPLGIERSIERHFVGRADDMWRLHDLLTGQGDPTRVAQSAVVITGFAGCGKSRLAMEYLHRYGPAHYEGGIFWINADPAVADLGRQQHAILRRLVPGTPPTYEEMVRAGRDVALELGEALVQRPAGARTLIVLDNVPSAAEGEAPKPLEHFVPASAAVTVLATARDRMPPPVQTLALDVLDPVSARELLTREIPPSALSQAEWDSVTEAVGRLPIALDLLNMAMQQGSLTPAEVLEAIAGPNPVAILDEQAEALQPNVPAGRVRGIGAAFNVSLRSVPKDVQDVLQALALFAPADIPGELLATIIVRMRGDASSMADVGRVRSTMLARSFIEASGPASTDVAHSQAYRRHRLFGSYLRSLPTVRRVPMTVIGAMTECIASVDRTDPTRDERLMRLLDPARRMLEQFPLTALEEGALAAAQCVHAIGEIALEVAERSPLAAPIHVASMAFFRAREVRTRDVAPFEWAATTDGFGRALAKLGEREGKTEALEEAVRAFEGVLDIYTPERSPSEWATAQNNLGAALLALGEREQGLERLEGAVHAYRSVLWVWTREAKPEDWALAQNNLANVLLRIARRETGTARIKEAIEAYQCALAVRTRERSPRQWAMTQCNLANALTTLGEREEGTSRFEEAVEAYQAVLEVRRRETMPFQWALTQNSLGKTFFELGRRQEGTEALEEAVSAFQGALEVFTQVDTPVDWAMAQNNLANALSVLGERTGETAPLMQAVEALHSLLEVWTPEHTPRDWANANYNLGRLLATLGEQTSRPAWLAEAIDAYLRAQEVWTRERVPLAWGAVQTDIGNTLVELAAWEVGTTSLTAAATAYRSALEERTRERSPLNWASTQRSLAIALWKLSQRTGEAAHLVEAIAACRQALGVLTADGEPDFWLSTQFILGDALSTLGRGEGGTEHLGEALEVWTLLEAWTRERVPQAWAATQERRAEVLGLLGQ